MNRLGKATDLLRAVAQHKGRLLLIAIIVLSWLFYREFVLPQRAALTLLAVQCQAEQQQVKTVETYAVRHPDSQAHLQELERKLQQLDAKLPNHPEIGSFIKEIEQICRAKRLRLIELAPVTAINKAEYREIPVEVVLRGSFANLLEFVKAIENSQRFSTISNINIQAKQEELEIKLIMKIYSYGAAAELSKPQPSLQNNK